MILPYHRVSRGKETRSLPLVPVMAVYDDDQSVEITALVDSGAEHNVFHTQVAEAIGLDLTSDRKVELMGFDGTSAAGHLATVELWVGKYSWVAPVIFQTPLPAEASLARPDFLFFSMSISSIAMAPWTSALPLT